MATQITSTPVVKGTEAVIIYNEANQKPSSASEIGAEKLRAKFSKYSANTIDAILEAKRISADASVKGFKTIDDLKTALDE